MLDVTTLNYNAYVQPVYRDGTTIKKARFKGIKGDKVELETYNEKGELNERADELGENKDRVLWKLPIKQFEKDFRRYP